MKIKLLLVFCVSILFFSCSHDPDPYQEPFGIAFKEKGITFDKIAHKEQQKISLLFSEPPVNEGSVSIMLEGKKLIYGLDYKTIPEAVNGMIRLPFSSKNQSLELNFVKLRPIKAMKTELLFSITNIDYKNALIRGNNEFVFTSGSSIGGEFTPTIGGSTEPNQVFIDLSEYAETLVKRDSWGLGFYSGETFNVVLNETNYMAAGELPTADIDQVTSRDVRRLKKHVTVFNHKPEDGKYADDPERDFDKNAIKKISSNPEENKVYLLNLGYAVPRKKPKRGSALTSGERLGWRKIRVLQKDNGYLLQYANLDDNKHKEVFIPKSTSGYLFTYFDFITEKVVSVAPKKTDWDISFTVFTNKFDNGMSYGFSDFVYSNKLGGVKIYAVNSKEENVSFEQFTKNNVDDARLQLKRTLPGSVWRNIFTKNVISDMFYVIQDFEGNLFKLRFLQLVNEDGERGHSKLEYALLK